MTTYNPTNDELTAMLAGRRITSVTDDGEHGTITLDNGTALQITPNEGCGGCSAGWYTLDSLNGVENVITRAESVMDETGDSSPLDRVRLYVFTEAGREHLATITGDEGNGYYGYGFAVEVKAS